jgi:hypothetical protein
MTTPVIPRFGAALRVPVLVIDDEEYHHPPQAGIHH